MKSIRGSLVVVAVIALASGCSGGTPPADEPTTVTVTEPVSSTSTATTSSSTSTAPTTTATVTATDVIPSSPAQPGLPTGVNEYADAFVRSWGIGDRPDASRYATVDAVRDLFGMDSRGGSSWARQDSTEQGARTMVKYSDDSGMALYVLVDRATAGSGSEDAVVGASLEYEGGDYVYDPGEEASGLSDITVAETTTGTYCDALVRAWGAGRRTTGDKYATDTAMTSLFDGYGTGGSGWTRVSAGTHSAVYSNTDGSTVTLYVNHVAVEAGRGDAVFDAEFS